MNNVNLKETKIFLQEVKEDLSKSKKGKTVDCLWNFGEGKPRLKSKVYYPNL